MAPVLMGALLDLRHPPYLRAMSWSQKHEESGMAGVPDVCGLCARRHGPTSESRSQIPFAAGGVGSLYTESVELHLARGSVRKSKGCTK